MDSDKPQTTREDAPAAGWNLEGKRKVQLYLRIPFCVRHCRCCREETLTGDHAARSTYLDALQRELDAAMPTLCDYEVTDILVGGGSPSIMSPDRLGKMVRGLRQGVNLAPHAQVDIQLIPQTVCTPSLTGLGRGGFNRASLSVQSVNDFELDALDCGFSSLQVQSAVMFLHKFGWHDFNVDLMYGIPGQTEQSWGRTLHAVRDFSPTHVTLCAFSQTVDASCLAEANTELEAELYAQACEYLPTEGFEPYTRQHFARSGHRSAYVVNRASGTEYIGFGLGARSFVDGMTYANTSDWQTYIEHSSEFETVTTQVTRLTQDQMIDYREECQALLA